MAHPAQEVSMQVSIIIVNYNTCRLLADCLASVYRQITGVTFEVIVVDNGSTDGSEAYITRHFPEVVWVNAGGNLGFGRANNLGVGRATGEYLFLLNSDTILCNDAVSLFYDYAVSHLHERIGALGSWLLDAEGKPNASCGCFPTPRSEMAYLFGKMVRNNRLDVTADLDVDYVTGADMFVARDLFMRLGGFDPAIFMYYEETDLQRRMADEGYVRRVITGPRIIHLDGGSFGRKGLTVGRFVMAQRSYNYYLRKHYRGLRYALYKSVLCLVRLTVFVTTDWTFKERLRAYRIVLSNG